MASFSVPQQILAANEIEPQASEDIRETELWNVDLDITRLSDKGTHSLLTYSIYPNFMARSKDVYTLLVESGTGQAPYSKPSSINNNAV